MDKFNKTLEQFQNYAALNNLVFKTVKSDSNGNSYIEYLKNEIDFEYFYDNHPVLMTPEDYSIEIKGVKKDYKFQTFFDSMDYRSGTFFIFAESHTNIDDLLSYLDRKYNKNKCMMFVWDSQRGNYINSKYEVTQTFRNNLVGLDNFFDSMKKEITSIKNHKELAILLGASSGANYFAYGPPGTGKTSSFKVLGNELNIPVYSVNLSLVPISQYKFALSPKNKSGDVILVIVEDFDRYIKTVKEMSELLNALDGVHNSLNTIRIFSANMPEITLKDRALKSRIKKFIKFDLPTNEQIYQHLLNVSNQDIDNAKKLVELVSEKKMSYRTLNNYLSRFITEESLLGSAVLGFDKWMDEFKEIEKLESKTTL